MTDAQLPPAVRVSRDVVFRDLDGEAVILDLASGVYFGLDPVGTRMWQLIEQHGSLGDVLDALCGEYDASRDTIERDLTALVTELLDKHLLESAQAQTS
jgi:hypothetical protein